MTSRMFFAAAVAIAATVPSIAAHAADDRIARIFDPEMIGANLAYFEQVTGPARNGSGTDINIYKVDGCEITAQISKGTIEWLRMDVSPSCSFNLTPFVPSVDGELPPVHQLTFGTFDKASRNTGRYMASCLTRCGNAADPVVYELWEGSRPEMGLQVMLGVVLVDDASIAASNAWQVPMEKAKGEDWVGEARFNCARNEYDDVARKAFRDITITTISIGYNLMLPECGR